MLTGSLSHFSRRHRSPSGPARLIFALLFNTSPLYHLRAWHRLWGRGIESKIIVFAVPADCRVNTKESETLRNIKMLSVRYQRCVRKVEVIPDVVGAIPKGLNKSLQNIGIRVRPGHVQKAALLGTARILRRVLEIWKMARLLRPLVTSCNPLQGNFFRLTSKTEYKCT